VAANPSTDNMMKAIVQGFRCVFYFQLIQLEVLSKQTSNIVNDYTALIATMEQMRLIIVDYWTGGGTAPATPVAGVFGTAVQGVMDDFILGAKAECEAEEAFIKEVHDMIYTYLDNLQSQIPDGQEDDAWPEAPVLG